MGINKFKSTDKDIQFEKLIKDLQPITRHSKELNFGTSSQAKDATNYTIEFQYGKYYCKVELK